jgi:GNAT superfamily N-acetyltransferase
MIHIRKQKPEDTPELEMLYLVTRQTAFLECRPGEFKIEDYRKSVAGDQIWVAHEGEALMGFVSISPADNLVHHLFVHPKFQGRGIGAALLQVAEQNLARPMILKVSMDNLRVCSFYEKYGWYEVTVVDKEEYSYALYRKD